MHNVLCLPLRPEEFKLYPVYNNGNNASDYATFSVVIYPCTAPNPRCLPSPPVNDIIVNTILPVKSFDPMNKLKPVKIYFEYNDRDTLDYLLEKEWHLDLNKFEVYDERYDYFNKKLKV